MEKILNKKIEDIIYDLIMSIPDSKNKKMEETKKVVKKEFTVTIGDKTYTVKRCYKGNDGKWHLMPSETSLCFVENDKFVVDLVPENGNWTAALLRLLADNLEKKK